MLRSVISLLSVLVLSIPSIPAERALAQDNPNIQLIKPGDPAMAKAHEKSIGELDGFLQKLQNPPAGTENYSLKLGFKDKDKSVVLTTDQMAPDVEFMWVYQIEASGDRFTALLGDRPEYIHNIKQGDRVAFEKADIFDWLYVENGKIKGNYTACPLLLSGPKEQLEQYREVYGIVCD
ncbi:hypothetical protein IE4803_CH03410 [Rhizobium etli bv. phaseoli str. IE4803]|uniref:DUF2314 domain-containing protein n=1 Tax=Rhizobium etli bv. mimosae str. IE4771 TaxID=1432050 RepID=A0A060HZZ1_RHIET|nr:DUF2314 domain-containing protein [Rhizobium sp. IE4771]AIC28528.1 hypothetical protein IE4771_CH03448 [Rhizobium sp. IE4771]AJC80577.1 hypothetical protein IE4803_CH03410 [Rhizobium etli bv. phaseoli str. IE4803]